MRDMRMPVQSVEFGIRDCGKTFKSGRVQDVIYFIYKGCTIDATEVFLGQQSILARPTGQLKSVFASSLDSRDTPSKMMRCAIAVRLSRHCMVRLSCRIAVPPSAHSLA